MPVPAPAPAAPVAPAPARTIEITANDQMRFSVTRIEAAPGERLTVVLRNIGVLPKTVMGHNWVLLQSTANPMIYSAAAAGAGLAGDFIPAEYNSQVIVHTRLLGPGEMDTVEFTVPSTPGEYPFLCSFSGHVGTMRGVLVVQ